MAQINTTNAYSVYEANGTDKTQLSIIYNKIFSTLLADGIGREGANAEYANINNVNGGTVIYYVGRRNLTKDYEGNATTQDVVETRTVTVQLDKLKIISYSYETLDIERFGAMLKENGGTVGSALRGSWLGAVAQSVEGYVYAKFTKLLVDTAVANTGNINGIDGVINIPIYKSGTINTINPEFEVPAGETYNNFLFAKVWNLIQTVKGTLQSEVNREFIGINPNDLQISIAPKKLPALIGSTTTLGSDSAREALLKGSLLNIAGFEIKINQFLGEEYASNMLDQNESFDLTACDMILKHREAVAVPFNTGIITQTVNPNTANPNFIHKFFLNQNGGVAIRPSLVVGFKFTEVSP